MRLTHPILGPLKVEKDDIVIIVSDLHLNHNKEFIWKYRADLLKNKESFNIKDINSYTEYVLRELCNAGYHYSEECGKNVYLLSLGDNCFSDPEGELAKRLINLPYFKHIYSLPGNHTSGIKVVVNNIDISDKFTLISECITLQVSKQCLLTVSHYPVVDTATAIWGTLCGHCHGSIPALNENNSKLGRIFDCGVDNALRLKDRPYFLLDECIKYLSVKEDWDRNIQLHRHRKELDKNGDFVV